MKPQVLLVSFYWAFFIVIYLEHISKILFLVPA